MSMLSYIRHYTFDLFFPSPSVFSSWVSMMATKVVVNALFIFFSIFLSLPIESSAKASNGGFSVELIHRDSPLSPFYDPHATASERAKQAVHQSLSRQRYFQSSMSDASEIQSVLSPGSGDYFMKLAVGSPPLEFLGVMDTGSDLIWTQCLPCNCDPQNNPVFDPSKSSTFALSLCSSPLCQALGNRFTCNNGCQYSYSYEDQSYTKGVLATEKFTFSTTQGSTTNIDNISFGCSHENTNYNSKASGLVGLGGGPLSLISQLGSSIPPKFSYCMMKFSDATSTSIMNFGDNAVISGAGVISTPITTLPTRKTFYFLTLNDISVGDQKLNIPLGTFDLTNSGEGGLLIDSGTTLTYLVQAGYDPVESAVKNSVTLPQVNDPNGSFNVCYGAKLEEVNLFPSMTFHFSGGDVHLSPSNTFIYVGYGVTCLAVFPSDFGRSTYGNIAQQNFRVGYDLVSKTVSFQQFDCTKM